MTLQNRSGPTPSTIPKVSKTNRACNHCHRSHLTCNLKRPCLRCILRGLELTCQDAPRKRKKYLENTMLNTTCIDSNSSNITLASFPQQSVLYINTLDTINSMNEINDIDFEFSTMANPNCMDIRSNSVDITGYDADDMSKPQAEVSAVPTLLPPFLQDFAHGASRDEMDHTIVDSIPRNSNQSHLQLFQQEQIDFSLSLAVQEYNTLSSIILDGFEPVSRILLLSHTASSRVILPEISPKSYNQNMPHPVPIYSLNRLPKTPQSVPNVPVLSSTNLQSPVRATELCCDPQINQYSLGPTGSGQIQFYPDVLLVILQLEKNDPIVISERNARSQISFAVGCLRHRYQHKMLDLDRDSMEIYTEPEEIYAKVKTPFFYTTGYHQLIANLKQRFTKDMLVRMAQLMAEYRPSFIACTKSLKECDLIFMEQCFQRTLLTLDNFIRSSGTPTIVWRRTGEIAHVGDEFCLLTGWLKRDLMGKERRFIVDLLDDDLVIEYFEIFSHMAFQDFMGSKMTTCTLLTPRADFKIRTGCSWTLNRDVFGIPMMIIGSFLPIV